MIGGPVPSVALRLLIRRSSKRSSGTNRKTATIRLGNKSASNEKGMIVAVLCGARFSPASTSSTP